MAKIMFAIQFSKTKIFDIAYLALKMIQGENRSGAS